MVSRRTFLTGAVSALPVLRGAAAEAVEFTNISDTHVMLLEGVDARWVERRKHYEHTREALAAFWQRLKAAHNPSFVLHTGDAIDAYSFLGAKGGPVLGQIEAFAGPARQSPAPVHLALGNHDVLDYGEKLEGDQSVVEAAKAAWIQAMPCFRGGTYYHFPQQAGAARWRVVVLNNGCYGQFPGREAPLRGGELDAGQLDWMVRELRRFAGEPMVIGVHIPPSEAAWGRMAAALGRREHLTAVFTGHLHGNNFIRELPGTGAPAFQIATPGYCLNADHWRRVRLEGEAMEVFKAGAPETVERRLTK
jgi:3',5'-cyclic AMP phosphodiesterase CpdA